VKLFLLPGRTVINPFAGNDATIRRRLNTPVGMPGEHHE
jgi:hypothetical protein